MTQFKHLFPKHTAATEQYTYARDVRSPLFKVPPRDDRVGHGKKLISELKSAGQQFPGASTDIESLGFAVDFESDPGFKLQLQSLELRNSGIELRNSRVTDDVMHATVFIPHGKANIFVKKFEKYCTENDKRSGKPKNKNFVESISKIRLAVLESFWTDTGAFPKAEPVPVWWELWLREQSNPHDIGELFREKAQSVGIIVGSRQIRFPERRVLLAQATVEQLARVENLFDILAELRLAKILAGEFVSLSPRDQAEFIEEALSRIQKPPGDAPCVCHLDTGVNRSHPLLEFALDPDHVLAADSNWNPADIRGHGTEMAGLALYGSLTSVLSINDPIVLRHRLESVKICPDQGANDPDLYGEITSQAVSLAEIAAPERKARSFCLTITADGRDEGYPSSWSGAIDQICSGSTEQNSPRRLIFASAGNTPLDSRHEYPSQNQLNGVEDPSQSWNAVTVGAHTELAVIRTADCEEWKPIALPGQLSPCSRTSIIWQNKAWPLKPDIVMEGGNQAIDPSSGRADYLDDLSLLTTRVSPAGTLLTTTGDTSAAAALAARYGALIWAYYPSLWPETVRALLVHSASWTPIMMKEFPYSARHNRLRCYGYGVPDLQKALWSASNAATLIIEGSLRPFDKVEGSMKTKDMHLHQLPWPIQVLQDLNTIDIRMKVTLSYFVEPSPGRQGWTRKHRYRSHGLRFEVKRPLETDNAFHKRISRAAWEEDEEVIVSTADDRNWELGQHLRCKGSIHSDTWIGSAAELASSGMIAVFPVTGWWKERPHLNCWNRKARYSLIVSIETPTADVDLYTPIANLISVTTVTEIEIDSSM
jgi:hypothetical protein